MIRSSGPSRALGVLPAAEVLAAAAEVAATGPALGVVADCPTTAGIRRVLDATEQHWALPPTPSSRTWGSCRSPRCSISPTRRSNG